MSYDLNGIVSHDFACFGSDPVGSGSKDYSALLRFMKLMEEHMHLDLTDEDHEEIARLTGNRGQGHLMLTDLDSDSDEEEMEGRFSYSERLGLHVEERLDRAHFRNVKDFLTFQPFNGWGSFDPNESKAQHKWWKENFKSLTKYAQAMLGEEESELFLSQVQELRKDPDALHVLVSDLLGIPKENIETSRKPGKAWYQEHKLGSELLNHRPDDGRMEDEIEDRGWKQDPDTGYWSSTGFMIPYLRDENGNVAEIHTNGGSMKVLNINICPGSVPGTKYVNLAKAAYDVNVKRTYRQEVIWKRLIWKFREAMKTRDESIKTCLNGKRYVYYKQFRVNKEECVVFSPIPRNDLRDDIRAKLDEQRANYLLYKDVTLIEEI